MTSRWAPESAIAVRRRRRGFGVPSINERKPHSADSAAQFDQDTTSANIPLHRWYEPREMAIIHRRCCGLMAMGGRKKVLNGLLQVAAAELPVLDCADEPLRIRFGS